MDLYRGTFEGAWNLMLDTGKIVARLNNHRATIEAEVCCHVGLMKPLCHDIPVMWHDWSVTETLAIKAICDFISGVGFF
jgi:hypothetical protein